MAADARDPRHLNSLLDWSSIASYQQEYADALGAAIRGVSSEAIELTCQKIQEASNNNGRIYVAGNGGSAAIAEHLCCDWTKGTHSEGHSTIACQSLTSNVALYSAIANDFGFEQVFDRQLQFFGKAGDVLIAISSSGNSQNILNAVDQARELGMFVAGFSGFSGGKLASNCDASIHVATNNYGIVEDAHQAVMHIIAQFIASQRDNQKQDGADR